MKPKQMKRIANGEVDKLRQIKECQGHEWVNPREIDWAGNTMYEYHCKHCPLAKLFHSERIG